MNLSQAKMHMENILALIAVMLKKCNTVQYAGGYGHSVAELVFDSTCNMK